MVKEIFKVGGSHTKGSRIQGVEGPRGNSRVQGGTAGFKDPRVQGSKGPRGQGVEGGIAGSKDPRDQGVK